MATEPNTGLTWQEANSLTTDALHNQVVDLLAVWLNCVVLDVGQAAPSGSESDGDRYIVGTGSGVFAGQNDKLAILRGGTWQFHEANEGVTIYNLGDGQDWIYEGSGGWSVKVAGSGIPDAPSDGTTYGRKDGAWEAVAGGGMTLINSAAAGPGGAASLTVGSIPGTYKSLVILFNGRGLTAAQYIDVLLRFNADSGTNYDSQLFIATATTPGYSANHGQTSLIAGYIAAASAPANRSGSIRIDVPAYAGTVFDKEIVGMSSMVFDTSAGTSAQVLGGAWRPSTPAAITSITLLAAAGSLAEGSELIVLGVG